MEPSLEYLEELGGPDPAPTRSQGLGQISPGGVHGAQSLALRWVSGTYLAAAAVGTWVAVRDDLAGRPFGWDLPLTPLANFAVGLGTALSAPLVLLLALVWLNTLLGREFKTGRRAAGLIAFLGIGFLVGMLAEPITWQLFGSGSVDLLPAAIIVANVVLPAAMVILALRLRGFSAL